MNSIGKNNQITDGFTTKLFNKSKIENKSISCMPIQPEGKLNKVIIKKNLIQNNKNLSSTAYYINAEKFNNTSNIPSIGNTSTPKYSNKMSNINSSKLESMPRPKQMSSKKGFSYFYELKIPSTVVSPIGKEITMKDIPTRPTKIDELSDKSIVKFSEEDKVKKLDLWDMTNLSDVKISLNDFENQHFKKNINENKKSSRSSLVTNFLKVNPESEILKNQEFQTINKKVEIRESLANVKLNSFSPYLQDLNQKLDQEQGAILLQNINITKRSFNFDVLKSYNYKNNQDNNKKSNLNNNLNKIVEENENYEMQQFPQIENEFVKVGANFLVKPKDTFKYKCPNGCRIVCKCQDQDYQESQLPSHKDIKNMKIDDHFLRFLNLKLEGNYDLLVSQDYYRKTLTDKIRVENMFRKELMRLIKLLYEKKNEKRSLIKKNSELMNLIFNKKEIYSIKKDAVDSAAKDFEKTLKSRRRISHSKNIAVNEEKQNFEIDNRFLQSTSFLDKEMQEVKKQYEDTLRNCKENSEINSLTIMKLKMELKKTKALLNFLMKDQVNYYLDLLKKGIDVRNEGLCWIIRRLLELNAVFELSSFPRFVEKNHIEYIINLAKKQIESNNLKIILKIMKTKQNKLHSERDVSRTSVLHPNTIGSGVPKINNLNNGIERNIGGVEKLMNISGFFNETIENKITKSLNNLFKKNETMMKINYESKIEEIHVIFNYFIY